MHRNTFREKRFDYITPSDYEVAEENGINIHTLQTRVYKLGWDIDRAITQKTQGKHKHWDEWCKFKDIANVKRSTFYSRKADGWSTVRAALLPPMTHSERAQKMRRYTEEQVKKAEENGISLRLVRYRVNVMGWDADKAVSTPKMTKQQAGQVRQGKKVY